MSCVSRQQADKLLCVFVGAKEDDGKMDFEWLI